MTSDTDIHDKLRAVFLAAIMVVSMAAVGATFAGSAAANTQAEEPDDLFIGEELVVDVSDVADVDTGDVLQVRQGILGEEDSERVAAVTVDEDETATFSQDTTEDFEEDFHYFRGGGEDVNDSQFQVEEQELDAEFEDDTIDTDSLDEAVLNVTSDNWEDNDHRDDDFDVAVTSDDLDQDELEDLFGDEVEDTMGDDAVLLNVSDAGPQGTTFDADFSEVDAEAGDEFDFDLESQHALADASASVEIVEPLDTEIDFAEDVVSEENGDIASIEFDVEGTDQVLLTIGQDDDDFMAELNISDIDTDDEVVVDVNTYLLGYEGGDYTNESAFEVENGDLAVDDSSFDVEGGPNASMVSEERYRLDAQPWDPADNDFDRGQAERANLQIEERSTDALNTWTAPWGDAEELAGDGSLEAVADAIEDGVVTEADEITDGDALIAEIEVNGLEGAVEYANNVSDVEDDSLAALIDTGIVELEFEETDVPRNVDAVSFNYTDSPFGNASIVEGSEDAYFAAFNMSDSEVDRDFDNIGPMEADFTVFGEGTDGQTPTSSEWGLVPPDGEDNTEVVNATFDVQEPTIDFDYDEDDQYVRQNAEDQEINGETNLAPGNDFRILADGPTVSSERVTVDSDGEWAGELDFTGSEDGDTYDLEVEDDDRIERTGGDALTDAILIQEEDVEEAFFEVSSADATAEPGEELEIPVEVENTGDEEDTQDITFSVEGDEVDSQELTLEGGESEEVVFDFTAPDEEGEYDWTVASDDDEASYTLTVEEEVDEPANFEIVDVTPGEDLTVDPGEALTIDAEVENTGEEEGTQMVVFNFAGEELLEEELTLDAGESGAVSFGVDAPEDEGAYDWFVSTEDDESATWTLTVEDDAVDEDDEDDEVDEDDDVDDTDDDGAGFGVIAAVLALLGAALLAVRRQVQLE